MKTLAEDIVMYNFDSICIAFQNNVVTSRDLTGLYVLLHSESDVFVFPVCVLNIILLLDR